MFILNILQIKFSNTKESVVFSDYNKFRKRKVQLTTYFKNKAQSVTLTFRTE